MTDLTPSPIPTTQDAAEGLLENWMLREISEGRNDWLIQDTAGFLDGEVAE